jgi:Trypsin-like peptidase domain
MPAPEAIDTRLAQSVPATVTDFAKVFERAQEEHGIDGPAQLAALVAAEVDPRATIAHGFAAARAGGWLDTLVMLCLQEDLVSDDFLQAVDAVGGILGETALQSILDARRRFADPVLFSRNLHSAMRQTCRINIDGEAVGTGFLLRPSVLMTAFHVVEPLIGDDDRPKPGSHERIAAVFDDYLVPKGGFTRRRKGRVVPLDPNGWLIGVSRYHAAEKLGRLPDDPVELDGLWDHAFLRLAGSAGLGLTGLPFERAAPLLPDNQLIVFQHPSGRAQVFDMGRLRGFCAGEARFEHLVNAEPGSSGAPCFNDRFRIVGFHQAGPKNGPRAAASANVHNRAVPIRPLIQAIEQLNGGPSRPAPLTVATTQPGHPVFGRMEVQDWAWTTLERSERNILALTAQPPGCGLSFCYDILRSLLPIGEHAAVKLSANNFATDDPLAFARRLLEALEMPTAALDPTPGNRPDESWIRHELSTVLVDTMAGARGNRCVWIMLDDLDKVTIPEIGGLRDLLDALYEKAIALDWLKFVLAGYHGLPSATVDRGLERCELTQVSEAEYLDFWRLRNLADTPDEVLDTLRVVIATLFEIAKGQGPGKTFITVLATGTQRVLRRGDGGGGG